MVKSDIDIVYNYFYLQHPSDYKILNGFDKAHDPESKPFVRDPAYKEPYYPYYNPELHRPGTGPKPRTFSVPYSRYTNNIYQKDQQPYYGGGLPYRVFNKPDVSTNRVN